MATYKPPAGPSAKDLQMNINPNDYKVNVPSLQDVQKEWGLEDPSKYANTIADKNAQIKYDQISEQRDLIGQQFRENQQTLDVDFFNQFRQQREQGALRGLNAGIQMQRDTQLDMQRQAQLSNIMRDNNNAERSLARQEARVELEKQAEALQIKTEEQQRQIDLAFRKGDFLQAEATRRQQLDTQKEIQRIEGLRWQAEQNTSNYWQNVDAQMADRQFAEDKRQADLRYDLDVKMFGIEQAKLNHQKRMDELNYKIQQQQAANDRWYKERSIRLQEQEAQRNSAANQAKMAKADFYSNLDKVRLGFKNKSIDSNTAMGGLINAYQDKIISGSEYDNLVKEFNKIYYDYHIKG